MKSARCFLRKYPSISTQSRCGAPTVIFCATRFSGFAASVHNPEQVGFLVTENIIRFVDGKCDTNLVNDPEQRRRCDRRSHARVTRHHLHALERSGFAASLERTLKGQQWRKAEGSGSDIRILREINAPTEAA
jgi:hypothetical protein